VGHWSCGPTGGGHRASGSRQRVSYPKVRYRVLPFPPPPLSCMSSYTPSPLPLAMPTARLRSLGPRAGDNATEKRLATQRRRPGGSRAKAALPRPTKSRPPSRLAGHSKSVEFGSAPRHSRSSCSRVVSGGARSRSWRASLAVEKFKPSSRRTTDAVSRAGTDSKHAGYLYLG